MIHTKKKYWDRKLKWPNCYQCGKNLSYKERACFGGREERLKGYCPDCYASHFSKESRINPWGELRCGVCKKYFPPESFSNDESCKYGKRKKCKQDDYKKHRQYLKSNPEKEKVYRKRHRKNTLRIKREIAERERETLHDNYIRRLLARYSDRAESDFTQEEIEAKRKWVLSCREMGGFPWWKSEMMVRRTLERIFPGHKFPARRPAWNTNPLTGHRMEIDCYNEKLNIGVEFNGQQHYEAIENFQSKKSFKAQQQRDIEKAKNCKARGVQLVTVPYWIENYEKFLRDCLGRHSVNL